MSLGVKARTSLARPDFDNVDGFRFVSFENLVDVDKYLTGPSLQSRRGPRLPATPLTRSPSNAYATSGLTGQSRALKAKADKKKTASETVSKVSSHSAATTKHKPSKSFLKAKNSGKKVPVWLKHKRRLRKGDKRVIVDKVLDFVFVSAFTVEDFDNYKDEIDSQVSIVSSGRKRKPADRSRKQLLGDAKKSRMSTDVIDEVSTSGAPVPDGKNLTEVGIKSPSKQGGRSDLVAIDGVGIADKPRHGQQVASVPESYGAKTSSKQKTRSRKRNYPRMQIDEAYNKTVSSSSDSDNSIITISDGPEQENMFLDVINVDELTSTQFIKNSIKMVGGEKGMVEEKRQEFENTNKEKTKKKKCRICCLYPSKIVEAKKISPLFGSSFPSYTVSSVSTCKLHPSGAIIVGPSSSKPGFVDTCIQTNAPDIKMHQDFAQRFPHRTIAVTTNCSRTLDEPKPRKKHQFLSKSEHHRTSEQKRREQMHDQFTELRQIITTSQAKPDNERASKQWILEHAEQVISTLEAEAVVLQALHKTLVAKNERLKKRWKELSGREFDPKIIKHKNPSKSPGQTKLMNLYKQYRKNVQRENSIESKPADSSTVGDDVCGGVESNQSVAASKAKNYSGEASPENLEKSQPSLKVIANDESTATAGQLSKEAVSGSKASQPVVTRNSTCTNMNKPSQDATVPKHAQSSHTVATNSSHSYTNNPCETVVVKPNQANSETSTRFAGMSSEPKTSSFLKHMKILMHKTTENIVGRLSHPKAVNNPSPTLSARTPSAASSLLTTSQPAVQEKTTSPTEVVNNPNMRMPGRAVTNQFLAVNQPKQAKGETVNLPTRVIPVRLDVTRARPFLPLCGPNQALKNKPTQWSAMSKLNQPEVNKAPLESDVGAVIEVDGGGQPDSNHKNDIVMLDVAQTGYKPGANSSEQARTMSRIPTSSSINVTLKSVGSITSNKIFNKKPIPPQERTQVGLLVDQTNKIKNPIQETESEPSRKTEQKEKALEPTIAQVPQISKTLFAGTFQGGKNIVDSANEPGLCIISSVFSLNYDKSEDLPKPACAKEWDVSKDFQDNRNSTIHDHNYSKCEAN